MDFKHKPARAVQLGMRPPALAMKTWPAFHRGAGGGRGGGGGVKPGGCGFSAEGGGGGSR
jgi:hypothetical protein